MAESPMAKLRIVESALSDLVKLIKPKSGKIKKRESRLTRYKLKNGFLSFGINSRTIIGLST